MYVVSKLLCSTPKYVEYRPVPWPAATLLSVEISIFDMLARPAVHGFLPLNRQQG
jgi:hypothetical protein